MKARENPFRSDRVESVPYHFELIDWKEFLERIRQLNFRGAIVGKEGAGKTTLMEKLALKLKQQGKTVCFLSLSQEHPHFSFAFLENLRKTIRENTVILVDGADRMSVLRWKWFQWMTRKASGLIITTHSVQWLSPIICCKTNKQILKKVLTHLLEEIPQDVWEKACDLFHANGGNIRHVLREFYEDYAMQDPVGSKAPVSV